MHCNKIGVAGIVLLYAPQRCRHFQAAVAATAAGCEVDALDALDAIEYFS